MTVRLLADENFNRVIVTGILRLAPDTDIARVQDVGLRTMDDPTILDWAAQEGRVVLSHDAATMPDDAIPTPRSLLNSTPWFSLDRAAIC